MTPEEWKFLAGVAGGVTGTTALMAWVYSLMTGKMWSNDSHEEVVGGLRKSEERAWGMVAQLTEARERDNAVLDKMAGSIHEVTNAVDALRQAIEFPRQRR